ncbi:uncharacterized protein [Penaeus vannamei]|uniref:uncharacterized protein n=1 Tax=Penaeus vannamei TaxID=6689 RepID=UPI00387FAEE0
MTPPRAASDLAFSHSSAHHRHIIQYLIMLFVSVTYPRNRMREQLKQDNQGSVCEDPKATARRAGQERLRQRSSEVTTLVLAHSKSDNSIPLKLRIKEFSSYYQIKATQSPSKHISGPAE